MGANRYSMLPILDSVLRRRRFQCNELEDHVFTFFDQVREIDGRRAGVRPSGPSPPRMATGTPQEPQMEESPGSMR